MSFTGFPTTSAFAFKNITIIGFPSAETGTGTIPLDDTAPLVTEGTEFGTTSFDPFSAASSIWVDAVVVCSSGTADRTAIIALFSGSTCIAATATHIATADRLVTIPLFGTTGTEDGSAITISIRGGLSAAGTFRVNSNGAQVFGGNGGSFFRVVEVLPI